MQAGDFSWQSLAGTPQRLLAVIVVVLIALLLARETVAIVTTLRQAPPIGTAPAGGDGQNSRLAASIASANLFGAAAQEAGGNDAGLPQTSLQLTLRGVFTGADPARGSAIIESGDGSTRIVRTGAAVVDDTLLERVYANRVVLSRNGLQESLRFPTGEAGIGLAQQAPEAGAAQPAARRALTEEDKRANILRRLEELRERSLERDQG